MDRTKLRSLGRRDEGLCQSLWGSRWKRRPHDELGSKGARLVLRERIASGPVSSAVGAGLGPVAAGAPVAGPGRGLELEEFGVEGSVHRS